MGDDEEEEETETGGYGNEVEHPFQDYPVEEYPTNGFYSEEEKETEAGGYENEVEHPVQEYPAEEYQPTMALPFPVTRAFPNVQTGLHNFSVPSCARLRPWPGRG